MGKAGKREYVQVLRPGDLRSRGASRRGEGRPGAWVRVGYDAVKHLVLCRIERRPPKLDLDIYPDLPRANVATTAGQLYELVGWIAS